MFTPGKSGAYLAILFFRFAASLRGRDDVAPERAGPCSAGRFAIFRSPALAQDDVSPASVGVEDGGIGFGTALGCAGID